MAKRALLLLVVFPYSLGAMLFIGAKGCGTVPGGQPPGPPSPPTTTTTTTAPPQTPPSNCDMNGARNEDFTMGPGGGAQMWARLELAISMVEAAPKRVAWVDSEHIVNTSQNRGFFWQEVVDALCKLGERSGVGDFSKGELGERDSVEVWRTGEDVTEGYHVVNFGGGGIARGGNLLNAYRGTSRFSPHSTVPSPTPSAGTCPLPMGEGRWIDVSVDTIGGNPRQRSIKTAWCTEVDRPLPPAGWPFECGSRCCRIGIHEGDLGLACERKLFGEPQWQWSSGVQPGRPAGDNPFNFFLDSVEGPGQWIRACGSAGPCSGQIPVP